MSVLTINRGTEESEALRLFLRLIRPRPLADPYPLYARLRDLAPFLPVRFPGVPAGYLVSTYAGCSRLLRDPVFGPPTHDQLDRLKPGWRDNAFTRYMYRSMVFRAGPAHREHRQAASRHFAPAQTARYRDELDQLAGQLVDRLARPGSLGPGPVDLMEHLALPFAALSLGRLLAIDDDEAIRLGRLARRVGTAFEQFASAEQHADVTQAGEELVQRLAVIVAGRPAGGQAGNEHSLLARLAASHAGADETEQLGAAVLLFGAGFDSPASMVGLGTRLLLEHPRQARLVAQCWPRGDDPPGTPRRGWPRGDDSAGPRGGSTPPDPPGGTPRGPGIATRAVAEILRYEPPVQLVARTALEPAELEGHPVPAGSMVFGLLGAANRDPGRVKEPEVFDVTREKTSSLSFGAGPHYCLGAYLASLQGEVLFGRLLRRFPGLRLAGPEQPPVYRSPGSTLRGLESLPVYLES